MSAEEVLRGQIAQLEKEQKQVEDKLSKMTPCNDIKSIELILQVEKIKFAINSLYICIGKISQ